MAIFIKGDVRPILKAQELATFHSNGSLLLNGQRTRPLWFDGRFLAARDLSREQDYFLQRVTDLGKASGFSVVHGLWVDTPAAVDPNADGETIIIGSGQGITPAGELVLLPSDLTIRLSDLPDEENLDEQFGLASLPSLPLRNRTGLYVLALRPVEFTAHPITSYPTSIQGSRTTHDGDIVEATAVTLLPFPSPVSWAQDSPQDAIARRSALARQIFVAGTPISLSDAVLPLAMISLQQGTIEWVDPYLVRRDSGPEFSGLRFGLADTVTQKAFLMQFDAQLQEIVTARRTSGLAANFAASNYFQALPPAGRFPLASLTLGTQDFSQVFFPQQMDVRLSVLPMDEIPAVVEESMSLPPIDLTLPDDAYSDLSVFALLAVPRSNFAALKLSLPTLPPAPARLQAPSLRSPLQWLRLYQAVGNVTAIPGTANAAWAAAIGSQTYGFYIRRRSSPTFVDFSTTEVTGSTPSQPTHPMPSMLPPIPRIFPANRVRSFPHPAHTHAAAPAPTRPAPRRHSVPTTHEKPKQVKESSHAPARHKARHPRAPKKRS